MHPSLTYSQGTSPGPGAFPCSSPTAGPDCNPLSWVVARFGHAGLGAASAATRFSKLNLPSRGNSLLPYLPWNLSGRESLSICPLSLWVKAQAPLAALCLLTCLCLCFQH